MVFYAGEVIAQGSAKEIREALKDLWKAGKSELKIKLSGLFRNKIFSKYATKFEKKFHPDSADLQSVLFNNKN